MSLNFRKEKQDLDPRLSDGTSGVCANNPQSLILLLLPPHLDA